MALLLTLYPIISNRYNQRHQSLIHTEYQEQVALLSDDTIPHAKAVARSYNEMLWNNAHDFGSYSRDSVLSAGASYADLLDLTGSGIMGYVHIPKLNCTLPIYHGTEEETLERGVGHLVGSSLPIGGENTHTILTGHSGLASQKMFSDLDGLKNGDVFYLEVLDEILAYKVDQINTVLPHDTTHLNLEQGQELCTLITCTPFGVNTHRLLVRGHRIPYTPEQDGTAILNLSESEKAVDSTWEEEYRDGIAYALGIVAIILIVLFAVWLFQKGAESNAE